MKTDTVFKRAFNRILDLMARSEIEDPLPSENALRHRLGVSRTTIRKVLGELGQRGVIVAATRSQVEDRQVLPNDYFPDVETMPRNLHIERQFMEWMLRGDTKPGTLINELELARQFGVATSGIREFLIRFSRFGLLEKRPNSGWIFEGFTEEFALDLFEIRVMFELRSARLFAKQSDHSPLWEKLEALKRAHLDLLREIDHRFHDFSSLDNRFHRLVNEASPNRFIDDFYDIITFIFHYHYQWNKRDEKQRNHAALVEHLAYIDALLSHDLSRVEVAAGVHLSSARETLLKSLLAPS
ncbi:GntR family transcriptional regulator [Mesorhizobium sp. M2A.F.Ca.ET.067.02.1.1]|uniref:GntR family transcriptional regulator n=1 Tax=Mesorhizobium sp. M2A.F.Ca.ET.067.02.1.1 TaxID=2496749 RepID=UPI000FD4102A|nr:GntR family transcriptional regulator [Mesorhizobium sp. M2A.F.Ca.ET.067.02.1.1]RUW81394.1 GntR family transcriptional regulator [Mesorhizobium sp. M2A.F.Ca.ET.067.02.1.1]TIU59247.1 MAG: GntR family transcriptional regulator [Mesorhizobium sp.]